MEKKMIVREFDPEEIPVVESFFFGDMTGTVMFLDIENSLRGCKIFCVNGDQSLNYMFKNGDTDGHEETA